MLCDRIGAPSLPQDSRFASNGARSVNRDALKRALEEKLANFECTKLADALNTAGVPCAPILSVSDAITHPHTAHRGMIATIGDSYAGVGSPIKLSRTPATYRIAPPRFKKNNPAG